MPACRQAGRSTLRLEDDTLFHFTKVLHIDNLNANIAKVCQALALQKLKNMLSYEISNLENRSEERKCSRRFCL